MRILLAEDDDAMRSLLVTKLVNEGFTVSDCCDAIELVNVLEGYIAHRVPLDYDLIISDIRMPWITGLELLKALNEYVGFPPVILITAFGDEATHELAKKLGAAAVLDKPFEITRLTTLIRETARGYTQRIVVERDSGLKISPVSPPFE
ncbi:MAG TPA: response regulator [Phycisphaerae bacterium]|nr:response regulator [Phycisphaerae bacterium]